PEYLVDRLIPIDTVGMFVAHGSSLKTWTMLSLASAVATGRPWLGKFVTRKGRVLIADYESGLYELRRRMNILEKGVRVAGLGAWPVPKQATFQEQFCERLAQVAEREEGLSLVCIDSLPAGAVGVDENDTAAATPLKMASRFSEEYNCSVLFVHHSK